MSSDAKPLISTVGIEVVEATVVPNDDHFVTKLKELGEMKVQGLLSEEEYEAAKAKLIVTVTPLSMDRNDVRSKETKAVDAAAAAWAPAHAKAAKARCPCCTSKDGAYIYGVVPTKHHYVLPLCLHLALCPAQECDPQCDENGIFSHCAANVPPGYIYGWLAWQSDDKWKSEGQPLLCWCAMHAPPPLAFALARLA
jgi:hypothetical protein